MIATLISWAKNIKLSLYDYGLLSLVALIGSLVVALKLQGSALHKAQVALLEARLGAQQDKEDAKVASLRSAFEKAKKEYDNA